MINTNPIESVYIELKNKIETSKDNIELKIQIELEKNLRKLYSDAIGQNTGYCMTFKIPEKDILNIAQLIDIDINKIQQSFTSGWKIPQSAFMANNPYYHILCLLIIYGIRHRNESIAKSAHSLMMCKLWNGRRMTYIKWCNPDIMRYVIANLSGKYVARKYDIPITMIIQYFTPTLLKKYSNDIGKDVLKTKRLFDQSWGRLRQLFVSNIGIDLATGNNKARSGIAAAYYDASEKGLKISKPKSTSNPYDSDNNTNNTDHYSNYEFDDVINEAVNYIVMNINPNYDSVFLNFVIKTSTVNAQAIDMILKGLHDTRYTDHIRDILELMFKQLQITSKNDICNPSFINDTVKRKFISSKHSPVIVQLKKIIDHLLEIIFDEKIKYVKYSSYSTPRQGHIRKVILYGFAYNLQKVLCSGKTIY